MKTKKIMASVKETPLTWALGILLCLQFVMIAFCNFTLIEKSLDCDTAKMFGHIREMWEQKEIFLHGWSYITTMEFDCGSLLALPIYGITGDIYFAYALANAIFIGLFIWVLFYLFRGQKVIYPILSGNLILIPYGFGMLDYFNMMFFSGSQYILKVMIPLILVGILLATEREKTEEGKYKLSGETIFFTIVFGGLFFLTCLSSGIYVMACGIVPVFAAYAFYKFGCWKKVPLYVIGLGALTVLCFLVGNHFNGVIMSGARGNAMILSPSSYMPTNILATIVAMFELFGGLRNTMELTILSVEGILTLGKMVLVLVFLACGICMCKWVIRKQADLRNILLLGMFVWNLFVLCATYTRAGSATYEYRYHLIGMIPLICVTVTVLLHYLAKLNKGQQGLLVACCGLFLLVIIAGSFREVLKTGEKNAQLKELCEYVEEMDVEHAYMYDASNDSDICRLVDNSTLYLCVTPGGVTWVYDYYAEYVDGPIYSEDAIFIVDEARYQFGDTFELFGYSFERFDTVAGRSLYYFAD